MKKAITILTIVLLTVLTVLFVLVLDGCGETTSMKSTEGYKKKEPNEQLGIEASSGNLEGVKEELNRGADVNAQDANGNTALHKIAGYSSESTETIEIIGLLIDKGANIEALNKAGATPLFRAASMNNDKAAAYLLDRGANINVRDKAIKDTVLHAAANSIVKKESAQTVALLLDRGIDINSLTPRESHTPLHWAAKNGNNASVELLISRGANVNARNSAGETPLKLAEEKGHTDTANILKQHGGVE